MDVMQLDNFSRSSRARRVAAVALTGLGLLSAPAWSAEPDIRRDATVEAVELVMPSVVNIATAEIVEYRDPFEDLFREFWGPYYRRREPNTQYSLGSGVIIDEDGYVLTNLHVVRRATRVWVRLADGREFEAKPIVGTTRSDVALLKIENKGGEKFRPVKFAKDDDLLLGETVIALGNPFGLGGSVSRGILSSKNRRAPRENEPLDMADWLQIDAPINFGNSGGPLINLRGELIGLNVAMHREGQGIGFAIPIKQVNEALSEIFIPEVKPLAGMAEPLWFGARIKSGPYPLTVTTVQTGSPAEKAGLRSGDQILLVNGKTPKDFIDCTELICRSPKHETALVISRGGQRSTVAARLVPLAELLRQRLGISAQELTRELAQNFGYNPGDGLLIADVEADGPAASASLQPGYLIAGMDGRSTPDLLAAADALAGKKKGERVELSVIARHQRGLSIRTSRGTVAVRVR